MIFSLNWKLFLHLEMQKCVSPWPENDLLLYTLGELGGSVGIGIQLKQMYVFVFVSGTHGSCPSISTAQRSSIKVKNVQP